MVCEELSIITIGRSADADLMKTHKSIVPILSLGAKWILVINEGPIGTFSGLHSKIIGKDHGLYNALNLGKAAVKTKYFMFLHSGDTMYNYEGFLRSFELLKSGTISCVLGGAKIGTRQHHSYSWRPYLLRFYVQPPHLPIIYRTSSVEKLKFDESINIVADFYFLKSYFLQMNNRFLQSGESYINMNVGGATTSGLKSLFKVTHSFYLKDGVMAYFLLPLRLITKLIIK